MIKLSKKNRHLFYAEVPVGLTVVMCGEDTERAMKKFALKYGVRDLVPLGDTNLWVGTQDERTLGGLYNPKNSYVIFVKGDYRGLDVAGLGKMMERVLLGPR